MSQTTTSTSSIEDLPWEMINELFQHLPPEDLVACSMVNKRWHSVYSNIKLHSLVVTNHAHTIRWYGSNRPIQEAERCRLSMFLHLAEKPLLSNLRHLAVYTFIYETEFDFNELNRFEQLVHLEINIDSSPVEKVRLTLPRLKVLAIHYWDSRCPLTIDAPQLSTLFYKDVGPWEVKHPETIRMLETEMVDAKLASFKAADCLVTKEFEAISKATLVSLPRLRELRYNKDIERVFGGAFGVKVGTVKKTLNEFLDEAKKLRGSDFRLTFAGLQLTNENVDQIDFELQVDRFGRERVTNEYVYMKNYHLIEPDALHYIRKVDYTDLLRHATGELPRCFSQKFTGIEDVYATAKVQDPGHLLWFLKSLRSLRRLELAKTGLGEEFYHQLPASAPLLISLQLGFGHCENGLQLNFDFIDKLSRLSELGLRPALSLESLPSFVRSLGRWKEAQFYVQSRDQFFSMCKVAHLTKWMIRKPESEIRLLETENPNEILTFFECLQADSLS